MFDVKDDDWKPSLSELSRLNTVLQASDDLTDFLSKNDAQLRQLQSRFNMLSDKNQASERHLLPRI